MAVPSNWFNEVGGFTMYLLFIIGTLYAAMWAEIIRQLVKDWRSKR